MINYQIKCKDLGFDSCNHVATGNSESELMRKLFLHITLSHDQEMEQTACEEKIDVHQIIKQILDKQYHNYCG